MIRLTAANGAKVDQLFTIQVINGPEAPLIAPLANTAPAAGTNFTDMGSFVDPDSSSWSATVDYGYGAGPEPLTLAPDRTFQIDHYYEVAGTYTVTLKVTDAEGLTGARTVQVTVTPWATFTGRSTGVRNEPLNFTGSLTGALPAGAFTMTWGFVIDSTPPITSPSTGAWQNQVHAFAESGVYLVTLTVTQTSTGRRTEVRQVVSIFETDLRVDPTDPAVDVLVIGGTSTSDVIRLLPGGGGSVKIWRGIQSVGVLSGIEKVVVYGGAGNDVILASPRLDVAAWLFGGADDDVLIGGSSSNVLLGEAGNDFVLGGAGRDLLAGGAGGDFLVGNAGDDLLISGDLVFTDLQVGLANVMKEWTSARDFVERADNLLGDNNGPRDNGASLLLVAQTIFDDSSSDRLRGGSDRDWYFSDSDEDTGIPELPDDRLTGL